MPVQKKKFEKMKTILYAAAALVAAFAVCLMLSGYAEAAEERPVSDRYFVFVGDSYAVQRTGITVPWPEVFQDALGIDPSHCLYARKGAYGFAKWNHKFIDLIRQLNRNKKVTDVIIMGGIGNDWHCTTSVIRQHLLEFNIECRRLFPNARIVYGFCNWNTRNADVRAAILNHAPVYKSTAESCGWIYLSGMEKILRSHPSYFQEDAHHPIQKAQYVIGNKIAELYKLYCVRKIRLNKNELVISNGKPVRLVPRIYPSTAKNKRIIWTSSNPRVAVVDNNGKVNPTGKGTTVIRAKTADGGLSAACTVTVGKVVVGDELNIKPQSFVSLNN